MFQEGRTSSLQMFGNTTLLSLTDSAFFDFTEFTDTVAATGISTPLSLLGLYRLFRSRRCLGSTARTGRDGIEPASLMLLCNALFAFAVTCRRRRVV